jgi:hypothetical protein
MGEWASYSLADFLMFSPATWWRLVARYNEALWPMQLLACAAGLALLRPAGASRERRAALLLLAAAWAWVGWGFHWQRYAEIFLGAPWLAAACGLQAALLLAAAASLRDAALPGRGARRAGLALVLLGLLAYPLLARAGGRPWSELEVFGVMPEPTALVTLGWLLATPGAPWQRAALALLPLASLLVGSATRWTLAQ